MKLLTKEIEKTLPKLYETEGQKNPIARVKFFNPCGAQTWYGIEYNPDERIFFGYVDLGLGDGYSEFGYFSLDELESISLPFGLKIERDLYFSPTGIYDLIKS